MTVPEEFHVQLTSATSRPDPSPPRHNKKHIYKDIDPRAILKIDEHALAIRISNVKETKIDYGNARYLIWNLLFVNNYDDLQKVRAIFCWLTNKNLKSLNFEKDNLDVVERQLNNFKQGSGSLARTFEYLARSAGLHAISIKGWAKGVDYIPGDNITAGPANHSWNAVCIDGSWQLIDCHWACRSETSNVSEVDDFYFLPEPSELIYSHFPENSAWQLLKNKLSVEDFESYPHIKSNFFTLGLQLLQQNQGVMCTKNGILTLTLGFLNQTAFTYKLVYGSDKIERLNGISLGRYILQEMTEDRVTYYFRAPEAGDYYLAVFARDVGDELPKRSIVFKCVSEYKIICEKAVDDAKPFPFCSDSSWGLDMYINQYQMLPNNKSAILICPDGKAEVTFDKDPDLRVYARLVRDGFAFETLKSCLTLVDRGGFVEVKVSLPEEGEYGLEIFANDKQRDGQMFMHFCQYMVTWLMPDFATIYGLVFDRPDLPQSVGADSGTYVNRSGGNTEDSDILLQEEYTPHPEGIYTSSISFEAPTNFEAACIDKKQGTNKPLASYKCLKVFVDVAIFKNVDTHAVEVAKEKHGNFRDLIWHLIYARGITNELEKARAIFVYLCSMDFGKTSFQNVKKDSPEELLLKLQHGQTTYAKVYETLCSYAGLHCQTVSGFAKGADYRPGMKFSGDEGQHSWNAVQVVGQWQLVDCHWAARRLVGKQIAQDNVRYELDEYYFMPDPRQLIFTHFPVDPIWQLLEKPVSLSEFEQLVSVKSAFFKYGLTILNFKHAVIKTNKEVTILIGCPSKTDSLAFTFTLAHEDYGEEHKGVEFNQFGMQYMVDNVSYFTIRFPQTGSYRLVMYAKDLAQQDGEGMYGGICEYEVVCEDVLEGTVPFPSCSHTSWGPGDSALQYSLTPLQTGAIMNAANDGSAEIRLKMPTKLRFSSKLKSHNESEDKLAPYLMQRTVNDVVIFHVNCPHTGEFGLEIYANNPEVDGQSLHHVYQYLIVCDELDASIEPFPVIPAGFLGPQPSFKSLGLAVAGSPDPYLEVDDGEVLLSFKTTQPVRMTSQLIQVVSDVGEDISEYVLQQSDENLVTFVIKLPKPGMYKFQLYAVPATETSESLPGVYNYLINCRNTFASLVPFPKQFGLWKDGCYLHEPLEGHLQPNRPSKGSASTYQHVFFKVEVPKATAVSVVIGSDWSELSESPAGTWSGEVLMESYWEKERKVSLCASFEDPPSQFGTLLGYSM